MRPAAVTRAAAHHPSARGLRRPARAYDRENTNRLGDEPGLVPTWCRLIGGTGALAGGASVGTLRGRVSSLFAPAVVVLTFIGAWNELLLGLILSTRNAVPVTVGATFFITSWGVKWGATAAMSMSVLPPLALGLVAYRFPGRAILGGALKG
jgi:hypothetical protein